MGCTSAKPKRTKSIEDIKGIDSKQSIKNGQIKSESVIKKDPVDPLLTTGGHKSFMAPDGIPFIDEDIDVESSKLEEANHTEKQDSAFTKNIVSMEIKPVAAAPVTITKSPDLISEEVAATKIQAGIRGFLGRQKVKNLKVEKDKKEKSSKVPNEMKPLTEKTKDEDIAATKIQANYKGYKTRKHLKEQKQ